jgi:carboxylesterase type B
MRRVTPDAAAADAVIAAVREARAGRGESVAPRDLWTAIATEYVFRVPTIRFADAHARAADPGVGTYCYLFTWESPALEGRLGSCHALEIPFVFGSVLNPMVQTFSGGGADAFALSAAMRAAWADFARSGTPEGRGGAEAPGGTWSNWDPARRPTTVLGPCPGRDGLWNQVERPRNEELDAVAAAASATAAWPNR